MGLKHNNYSYNNYGRRLDARSRERRCPSSYPGEDASKGEVFLFGANSPARQDLGVSHWKYSKADGEYSKHTTTAYQKSHTLGVFTVWI